MPIALAIISLAQGLAQAKAGDKAGGAMTMFNAGASLGKSFGSLVNGFNTYPADGVRRNYL